MNPYRFRRSGRFRPKPLSADAPLLDAILKAKSPPHRKGWETRRANSLARALEHCRQIRESMR
jgi:hypothetical protein